MTRAADWLYVCHPRRQASGYGGGWLGDTYEQTTLTRFITKEAKRLFECQSALTFRPLLQAEPKAKRKCQAAKEGPC